jgi:DNA mismatch repair protein MutS
MGLIQEYLELQKKHEAQYGERTVVLMAVGVFYEIYEYDPTYCTSPEARIDKQGKVWNEQIGHAVEISVILNCALTFENSNEPYSILNPNKAGFPVIAFEKNRATLLANDYTIVRVDQEKSTGKGPVNRYVSEICSPTMQFDSISLNRPTSNIACIYVEYQQGMGTTATAPKFENFLITTGVAVIDVITGNNRVCEFYSKVEDQVYAIQEMYRFLISHYPRELVVHIDDMPAPIDVHTETNPNPYIKYLEKVLELRRFDRLVTRVNDVAPDYKRLPYQIEFLNKIFTKPIETNQSATPGLQLNVIQKRNERIIEELGLERMNYGRIAYMLLLQHIYSHNTDIISKLSKPDLQWIDERKHLILTHNAIVQLDLVSEVNRRSRKNQIDSLMSVLDHNQTHLGRRSLQNLLQNPMSDPNDISIYYNMIDEMSSQQVDNQPLWFVIERHLKELPDIGRLQRKLEIKLISPKELAILYKAYIKIINLYVMILQVRAPVLHSQMMTKEDVANFNQFIARFTTLINFETLECCHIDTAENERWMEFTECPIRKGIFPDIDAQVEQLLQAETNMQQIVDHLNTFLMRSTGKKLEFKAAKKKQGAKKQLPTGTILATTNAKATALLSSPIDTNLCGVLQTGPYTSTEKIITSDRIHTLCTQIDSIRAWMRQRLLEIYELILDEMTSKFNFFVPVANLIAKIDLLHSYSKVTYRFNYSRPELVVDDGASFVEAREIRHPIIERLIDTAYVTNDVLLGRGDLNAETQEVNRTNGMLLYGLNMTGKSSLAKAIALNIIMAQIGCYTSSHLRYKPYSKIITRLSGNDNLFRGESSFAIEMSELRTILRQSDSKTLIVGDEISRGSENVSATGIIGSAILSLIGVDATFIFATHVHDLVDLPHIQSIEPHKLKICHLTVTKDPVTNCLIYERKLQPSNGPHIYGIMVAESLGLPADFIAKAYEISNFVMGIGPNILSPKRSQYNRDVYVNTCSMCGKTKYQTQLHTHHIVEQKHADPNGIIKDETGIMHKNLKGNLLILCENCHRNLHQTETELETVTIPTGKLIRMKSSTETTSLSDTTN